MSTRNEPEQQQNTFQVKNINKNICWNAEATTMSTRNEPKQQQNTTGSLLGTVERPGPEQEDNEDNQEKVGKVTTALTFQRPDFQTKNNTSSRGERSNLRDANTLAKLTPLKKIKLKRGTADPYSKYT